MWNQCQYPPSNGKSIRDREEGGVMARDEKIKKKETDEQPEVTAKGSCSDSDPSISAALPTV